MSTLFYLNTCLYRPNYSQTLGPFPGCSASKGECAGRTLFGVLSFIFFVACVALFGAVAVIDFVAVFAVAFVAVAAAALAAKQKCQRREYKVEHPSRQRCRQRRQQHKPHSAKMWMGRGGRSVCTEAANKPRIHTRTHTHSTHFHRYSEAKQQKIQTAKVILLSFYGVILVNIKLKC